MKNGDGPGKEKTGTVLEEKKRDVPGREKRGTVLDSYFKDRPLFYKISLHISVDGSAKNVIFCRTKNA